MYNYTANIRKFNFKDYLPTPLKKAPLTEYKQLIQDIQGSSRFVNSFPILNKIDNFHQKWLTVRSKVLSATNNLTTLPYENFDVLWKILDDELIVLDLESDGILTVSSDVLSVWPLDLSFAKLSIEDSILIDYLDQTLNPRITNIWEDLLDSTQEVYQSSIINKTKDLVNVRNTDYDSDSQTINLTARLLGLSSRKEILEAIGYNRIRALLPMLGNFHEISGTDNFIKLIELVIASNVLLEHLYSKDYINFKKYIDTDLGPKLDEDSNLNQKWFKTTHINLYVEYEKAKYLSEKITAPLGSTVLEIVEKFLPINLVFKNFGLYYEVDSTNLAPQFYFCGSLDSIYQTREIFSDGRKLLSLIPM